MSLKPNRLVAPLPVCRGRFGRVALARIRIRAASRSNRLRSNLRDPELPARCEIARPAWNIIDEIVCLAEHFAEMGSRAGANVRQDVGAGFPLGLVQASNRAQSDEHPAFELVD